MHDPDVPAVPTTAPAADTERAGPDAAYGELTVLELVSLALDNRTGPAARAAPRKPPDPAAPMPAGLAKDIDEAVRRLFLLGASRDAPGAAIEARIREAAGRCRLRCGR
ncbi:hypothetical protein ACFVZH_13030 [Streptomyces sp. NPDC059534]|uniref:hypothetical protein n=1 Tax=Streptomyces sp. NPDC059534 TaxID=3346859 RepID=UPI0036A3D5C9